MIADAVRAKLLSALRQLEAGEQAEIMRLALALQPGVIVPICGVQTEMGARKALASLLRSSFRSAPVDDDDVREIPSLMSRIVRAPRVSA